MNEAAYRQLEARATELAAVVDTLTRPDSKAQPMTWAGSSRRARQAWDHEKARPDHTPTAR